MKQNGQDVGYKSEVKVKVSGPLSRWGDWASGSTFYRSKEARRSKFKEENSIGEILYFEFEMPGANFVP